MPLLDTFRTRALRAAEFIERYLLSVMYLWLAGRAFLGMWAAVTNLPTTPVEQSIWFVAVVRELDLFCVQLLIGLLLLRSHPPAEKPRNLREVFVPLAVSVFFVLYSLVPYLPEPLRRPLAPVSVQVPCAIAAVVCGAMGSLVALWGVLSLGRSFGIFVAVRKVVLTGPYRYVRHPIYSGYVLVWLGLVLANLSIAVTVIVVLHTLLMIYRARLEEARLAEASPEYREYMREVGFLVPR